MVDSRKGITNLHVPNDVIIDASVPVGSCLSLFQYIYIYITIDIWDMGLEINLSGFRYKQIHISTFSSGFVSLNMCESLNDRHVSAL